MTLGNDSDFEFLIGLPRGGSIEVSGKTELSRILTSSNTEVQQRSEGRENRQRERYCFNAYLRELLKRNELNFPLILAVQEKPDFLITMPDRVVGVEHTDTGDTAWLDILDNHSEGVISTDDDGWLDDEQIDKWLSDVKCTISNKLAKLVNYGECQSYELLVYDNSRYGLFPDDMSIGLERLSNLYKHMLDELALKRRFDELWIIHGTLNASCVEFRKI